MKCFDGVIVVEGKGDASFLSSFIDSEFVILNGCELSKATIDYLTHIKNRKILLCADPDAPGILISKKFLENVPHAINVDFNIKFCNKKGKHGVAECEKSKVLEKLEKYLSEEHKTVPTISIKDFNQLGLFDSKEKQMTISCKFHLGDVNTKTLFKRINYNQITKEELEEALNQNGNQ